MTFYTISEFITDIPHNFLGAKNKIFLVAREPHSQFHAAFYKSHVIELISHSFLGDLNLRPENNAIRRDGIAKQ